MNTLDMITTNEPPKLLYHYTSPAGLHGIIKSKCIWASNLHYLNDSREFSYTSEFVDSILKEHNYDPEFSKKFNLFVKAHQNSNKFVFSLSESENLLSQWRGYCPPTGGYSLGFDSKKLQKILSKENKFQFCQCQYDKDIQYSLVHEFLELNYQQYRKYEEKNDFWRENWSTIASQFGFIASIIKHPSWSEEKEWRVVSKGHFVPLSDSNFDVRVGKHYLIPYMKISMGDSSEEYPFKGVMVGPNPHQKLAGLSALNLLAINEIIDREISYSEIPFRAC